MNTTDPPTTAVTSRRRSAVIGALGTIIEWYDFSLYLYLAPVLSRVFFGGSGGAEAGGLIATFGVFAAAYVARPVGAVAFGSFGDRYGRRLSLVVSAAMMAVALGLTALLPGAEAIGVAAAVLLLLLRIATSFAVGGEYSGILVFLLETGSRRHRGLVASLAPATSGLGALLALAFSTLLVATLTQEQLDAWGWRLSFALGAALSALFLLLRATLEETPDFRAAREPGSLEEHPVRAALRDARGALFVAFALSAVGSVSYYLGVSYIPAFLETVAGVEALDALSWSTLAGVLLLVVTPLAGWASDRWGRRPLLLVVALALAAGSVPLFALLAAGSARGALAGAVGLAVLAGAWSAVAASAIPERFPTAERFSGIAIGYNAATAVFGGLTPLAATLLISATGIAVSPAFALVFISLAVMPLVWRLSETATGPLTSARGGKDRDPDA